MEEESQVGEEEEGSGPYLGSGLKSKGGLYDGLGGEGPKAKEGIWVRPYVWLKWIEAKEIQIVKNEGNEFSLKMTSREIYSLLEERKMKTLIIFVNATVAKKKTR